MKTVKKFVSENLFVLKMWVKIFHYKHPKRFTITTFFFGTLIFTMLLKGVIIDTILKNTMLVSAEELQSSSKLGDNIETTLQYDNSDIKGVSINIFDDRKIRSDVGFTDLRVLALEEYFNYYHSPLAEYSSAFIKSSERYGIKNWQLLPAIAMAETIGCQTGYSFEQKNCWGWGGSGKNRRVFKNFDEAIDFISYRMIKGYGEKYLNAKDIQNTYCGNTCAQWGWRWAQGVNYYVIRLNDFGVKYGLERTNETHDWS